MIDKYKFGIAVNPQNIEEITEAIMYLNQNKAIVKKWAKRA